MNKSKLKVTVVGKDALTEKRWVKDLEQASARAAIDFFDLEIRGALSLETESALGQIIAVDAELNGLTEFVAGLDTDGRAVFLLVPENTGIPALLKEGLVDDVLVAPFRPLEVLGKLRQYRQLMMWDEVQEINTSFSQMIARFQDSLSLAERLQKTQLPVRFPTIKGFEFAHRYLAGTRPGGDFLDIAESKDQSQISVLLTDSSSYGLSSSVLAALMEVTSRLSIDQVRSCGEIVLGIQDILLRTMSDTDTLSLLYAVINRKDLSLRYVNLGSSKIYWVPNAQAGNIVPLPPTGGRLSAATPWGDQGTGSAGIMSVLELREERIQLEAGGRIWFASDGFIGSEKNFKEGLAQRASQPPIDFINEQVFRVKSDAERAGGMAADDDSAMPEQDATILALHVDQRLKRVV